MVPPISGRRDATVGQARRTCRHFIVILLCSTFLPSGGSLAINRLIEFLGLRDYCSLEKKLFFRI